MAFAFAFRPIFPNVASLLGAILTFVMMLPAALAAQAEGQALFETRCARCHDGGPAGFKTGTERVAAVLRGGTVRQHRFTLSETQLNALTEYLRRGAPR